MTVERAILYGTLAEVVQIRNMFTCEVIPSGGDDSEILWGAYMSSMVDAITDLSRDTVHYYQYETQLWETPNWTPLDVVDIDVDGAFNETGVLPNQVALVLIGKAAGIREIGRKFISGLDEGFQEGGLVIPAYAALLTAVLAAWLTPF